MGGFVVIECEKFPILLTLFHNHIAQQNALKPLYKTYILGFYFCLKPYLCTWDSSNQASTCERLKED
jgi:hypothetical protein